MTDTKSRSIVDNSSAVRERDMKIKNFSGDNRQTYFDVFSAAKTGLSDTTNNNNFYLNGAYMRNFKFVDYTKAFGAHADRAIFAVTAGSGSDGGADAARHVLNSIDNVRESILGLNNLSSAVQSLVETLQTSSAELAGQSQSASVVVAVFYDDSVVSIGCGNCSFLISKSDTVRMLNQISQHRLGKKGLYIDVSNPYKVTGKETFALCSGSLTDRVGCDIIGDMMKKRQPIKQTVIEIFDMYTKFGAAHCATAMLIKVRPARSFVNMIIAGVAAVAVLCCLIIMATSSVFQDKSSSDTIAMSELVKIIETTNITNENIEALEQLYAMFRESDFNVDVSDIVKEQKDQLIQQAWQINIRINEFGERFEQLKQTNNNKIISELSEEANQITESIEEWNTRKAELKKEATQLENEAKQKTTAAPRTETPTQRNQNTQKPQNTQETTVVPATTAPITNDNGNGFNYDPNMRLENYIPPSNRGAGNTGGNSTGGSSTYDGTY